MPDLILTGVKPHDLNKLPRPVRNMTVGSMTLTWITVEDGDVDQYAGYGTAWYVWPTHYVAGHDQELTMRIITPILPYVVTKVDLVCIPRWEASDVPVEEWDAKGLTPAVLRWADWLAVAPIVGTVLDDKTVLVHDNPAEEAWQELYQQARSLSVLDDLPPEEQAESLTQEWTPTTKAPTEAEAVLPKVQARLESLPPDFTKDLKTALMGAEMMFRLQGGCAPAMQVWTTEDGEFLSPVPDSVQSYEQIVRHMWSLLKTKPGVIAVYFSFTSTPQGGGSVDGRGTLNCLFMTNERLHKMQTQITGARSLGDWTLETVYPEQGERGDD